MLKIHGDMSEIDRVRIPCPPDGVHRASLKDGCIKGCRSVTINGKVCPRGVTGFYWHYDDKPDLGVKVFWSFNHFTWSRYHTVKEHFKRQRKLYKAGVGIKAYDIIDVHVEGKFSDKLHKKHKIEQRCFGIVTDHVYYPEKAWEQYAYGYPYDWNILDQNEHPLHNPAGYLAFTEEVRKACLDTKVYVCGGFPVTEPDLPKLGDVVYCEKKKRWFIVDAG